MKKKMPNEDSNLERSTANRRVSPQTSKRNISRTKKHFKKYKNTFLINF